jgi:hypothetical protein
VHRIIIIFSFLIIAGGCFGQWDEDCPEAMFLLRDDTIFSLNIRLDGSMQFIPWVGDKRLDSIAAMAMHEGDYYGINYTNAHVIKMPKEGFLGDYAQRKFEDLGHPINEKGDSLPNFDLTSAVIVDHEMFILSYSTNSIYGIDLKSKPLRYRIVRLGIPFALPNTLSYHPTEKKLYVLEQTGRPIMINIESGEIEVDRNTFTNFPRRPMIASGKLWFGRDGRCFLLAGRQGTLYELDTKKMVAYQIRDLGFNSTKDAFYCLDMDVPAFLEPNVLDIWAHLSQDGHSLELEWHEGNSDEPIKFYHSERLNPKTGEWEPLSFIPGYTGVVLEQVLRYNALDRIPKNGENCYRLRIEYYGGVQRFSRTVCVDYPIKTKVFKKPTFRLSPELLSQRGMGTMLQLSGAKNQLVNVTVYRVWDGVLSWSQSFRALADDYSIKLPLPNMEGWYAVRVACGAAHQWFKVFLH